MTLFRNGSIDDGGSVLKIFGTFWRYIFSNNTVEFVRYLDAAGNMYVDSLQQLKEFSNSVAKDKVPILSTRQWSFISILESSATASNALKISYGTEFNNYGNGKVYGQIAETNAFSFDLPAETVGFSYIYNNFVRPTDILVNDIDFSVNPAAHTILFKSNPFDNPNFAINGILDEDGNVVDRELGFWVSDELTDKQHIFVHFGYVLAIFMQSSALYRDFISALWDALVRGPSKLSVNRVFSALTGIPLAGGGDTVQKILVQDDQLFIITDLRVYEFKASSSPLVAVGDLLTEGQILVDSLVFIEVDDPAELVGIEGFSLGQRFLDYAGQSSLFFENKEVELQHLGFDIEGRAIVEFEVSGLPADITEFWRQTHKSGVDSGTTLANYLDIRANPPNEPGPNDVPEMVNPFLFIMENLFKNNLYIINIKAEDIADGSPGLSSLANLVDYLPPHTTFVVFVEIDQGTDTVEKMLVDVDPTFGPAIEPSTDVIGQGITDLGISFKTVQECIN